MESQNILIKNATIINPLGNGKTEEKNADVLIVEDKIAEIGNAIDESNAEKIIDATDKILMPGLVNTHTHISMSLLRGIKQGVLLHRCTSWCS